jgi:glycosyltransferase involved in cell wall biosynthesis
MLVRDEADVIEMTMRHLAVHVTRIYVLDNGSTDGTYELLNDLRQELPLDVFHDHEVGYWQSRKMTELARYARERGFSWIVPCDADELWYPPGDEPLRAFLGAQGPDVGIVKASLYNHLPTGEDPVEGDVRARLGWRMLEAGALPKVACRAEPSLTIEPGNHAATYKGLQPLAISGLTIRHFSWRSPEQYLRKIRNGAEAYSATDLPEDVGAHWRMFDGASDEAIMEHFRQWFFVADPVADHRLIYDPARKDY